MHVFYVCVHTHGVYVESWWGHGATSSTIVGSRDQTQVVGLASRYTYISLALMILLPLPPSQDFSMTGLEYGL